MDLSIIMPTLGRPEAMARVLAALGRQRLDDLSVELIVVHDGGPHRPTPTLPTLPFPTHLLIHPKNLGRGIACNTGAATALGKVLLFLDDDLVPARSDFLRHHLELHRDGRRAVMGRVTLPRLPSGPWSNYVMSGSRSAEKARAASLKADPFDPTYCLTGNFSLLREDFSTVGGYESRFREYGYEDTELGVRLTQAGIPLDYQEELEVIHLTDATSVSVLTRKTYQTGKNAVFMNRLHPGIRFSFGFHPEAQRGILKTLLHLLNLLVYPALPPLTHALHTLGWDWGTLRAADRTVSPWKARGILAARRRDKAMEVKTP